MIPACLVLEVGMALRGMFQGSNIEKYSMFLYTDSKGLLFLLTDQLHRPLARLGGRGQAPAREEPLTGHIEIFQFRQLHLQAFHHVFAGRHKSFTGSLYYPGIPYTCFRSGNIDHFDVITNAGIDLFQDHFRILFKLQQ